MRNRLHHYNLDPSKNNIKLEPSRYCSRKNFSLIELLFVSGLVLILAAILAPHVNKAVDSSRSVKCQNNINQLTIAIKVYIDKYGVAPIHLEEGLKKLVTSDTIFTCPLSDRSYEQFYIARNTRESHAYMLGCPKHYQQQIYKNPVNNANIYCKSGTIKLDGQEIEPGQVVSGGILEFSDGSSVQLNGKEVNLIAHFIDEEGVYHTVLRMYEKNAPQTIDVNVNEGSHFTIKTPSAVAGVRGTKFSVSTSYGKNKHSLISKVKVNEGKVYVEEPDGYSQDIVEGEELEVEVDRAMTQRDPADTYDVDPDGSTKSDDPNDHKHYHRHGMFSRPHTHDHPKDEEHD